MIGFEIKRTDRPTTSKSMHIAARDLDLDHLVVVHAGRHRFPLAEKITAIGAVELLTSRGSAARPLIRCSARSSREVTPKTYIFSPASGSGA